MPDRPELLKTALHSRHLAAGATMTDEAGWDMPLSYRGAIEEVRAVRTRAGVMDVSHLGRLRIRGAGAAELLERLCTADVAHQEDNTARLTLLCSQTGGIIDQCYLLRPEGFWVLLTSPCNRLKVLEHVRSHAGDFDAKVDDQTEKTSMLSVTGPQAPAILDAVLPEKASQTPAGAVRVGSLLIAKYIVMRTGYSGEWGLEAVVPNMAAGMAWDFITKKAGPNAAPPIGMAARDVLRIEAGLPRYGHEINETIDPITAGLEGLVDFSHEFLGREAVMQHRERPAARRRVGLVVGGDVAEQSVIPRQGAVVLRTDGGEAGTVTSGTYSPTLDKVIAMAYVGADAAEAGTELLVQVGAERRQTHVVELPFHRGSARA